jgi:hypothetical protein
MKEILRKCYFKPMLKGYPTFTLETYSLGYNFARGKEQIGYTLKMHKAKGKTVLLFEGDEFYCSPLVAIDSNDAIKCLMSFLTLRKGDTDAEYFEKYTEEQKEYCEQYAEYLSMEVSGRYGYDD